MAKYQTKTIKSFTEKGLYNPEDGNLIGSKDGEVSNIEEVLRQITSNGDEVSITIKVEDAVDSIED